MEKLASFKQLNFWIRSNLSSGMQKKIFLNILLLFFFAIIILRALIELQIS